MKVKTFYPDLETTKQLNELFALPYHGQDWEFVNADADKLEDFIRYYLSAETVQEKVTIFALVLASIDSLENEKEIVAALDRILSKVKANLDYHLSTIIYLALIGVGENEEHIFSITKAMRRFLREQIKTDKIEIKTPSIEGIVFNELDFPSLLKEQNFCISFSQLLDFFLMKTSIEDQTFELSENSTVSMEKEIDFTHFEVWSFSTCYYFKVATFKLEKELGKYNIKL